MHPDVENAIEQIDAAIFSGDAGGLEGIQKLKGYCERWMRELTGMEECFKEVEEDEEPEPERVRVPLDMDCIDSALVAFESHKRSKNWVANVDHDPKSPGGLSRDFWKRGSGSYVIVPEDLKEGDIIEFAAEYFSGGGRSNKNRKYMEVSAMSIEGDNAIYLVEVEKP